MNVSIFSSSADPGQDFWTLNKSNISVLAPFHGLQEQIHLPVLGQPAETKEEVTGRSVERIREEVLSQETQDECLVGPAREY